MTQTNRTPFTMGVEEEYLLVDPETRDLAPRPPGFFDACAATLGPRVAREFYRPQIEIGTPVLAAPHEVAAALNDLRATVGRLADEYGVQLMAAAMHPFARQLDQEMTPKPRYAAIMRDLGLVGRRMVVCGMHVHVGIADPDERIEVMTQVRYFLPHLAALAASSPFFEGDVTGLRSYRLAAYHEVPRTGLPCHFASWADYRKTLDTLVNAGVIEDASKVWWDIRPSDRYPTLELRITDVCTRTQDAAAIAALYACTVRMLQRLRRQNIGWRAYSDALLAENRWRAMRYGVHGTLFDFASGELRPCRALLDDWLERVREDAEELGCVAEIEHTRRIARLGSSADRQLEVYEASVAAGATPQEALETVVDHLVAETRGAGRQGRKTRQRLELRPSAAR
jgi:carboxylate-amine ligase